MDIFKKRKSKDVTKANKKEKKHNKIRMRLNSSTITSTITRMHISNNIRGFKNLLDNSFSSKSDSDLSDNSRSSKESILIEYNKIEGINNDVEQYIKNKIPETLIKLHELMKDDNNLMEIYTSLRILEKSTSITFMELSPNSTKYIELESQIDDIRKINNEFEIKIWKLIKNVLKLSQENPEIIKTIIKIVDEEENSDRILLDNLSSEGNLGLTDKKIRGYMGQVFEVLQESIDERFNTIFEQIPEHMKNNINNELEAIKYIINDLMIVKNHLSECFPFYYNCEAFYQKEYHKRVYSKFLGYCKRMNDIKSDDILSIIRWIHCIYEPLLKKLSVNYDLQPSLSTEITELVNTYKQIVNKSMIEWCNRIIAIDYKSNITIDQLYFSEAPATLFGFINQQIDLVIGTGYMDLIIGIVNQCIGILNHFQISLNNNIMVNGCNMEIRYLIACANNTIRLHQYTIELVDNISLILKEKMYIDSNVICASFEYISECAIDELIKRIFLDLGNLNSSWTTSWYNSRPSIMANIIATLEDYLINDIQGHMIEHYFRILVKRVLHNLVENYTWTILRCKQKMNNKTIQLFSNDIEMIKKLFINFLRDNQINNEIDVLNIIYGMLQSSPDLTFLFVEQLLKERHDITIKEIEGILYLRNDLSRSEIKNALKKQ